MSVILNLGSIILGLIAWGVPIAAAIRRKGKSGCGFLLESFGACLLSLTLQFFEIRHRVHIEDLVAIMDTIDVLSGVVVVLVTVTFLLNACTLFGDRRKD
ncbi:MAG: hypothetical protein EOM52_01180 [Clostridia bacterium]|nr:hypothetical protein [Clostridia bacterium]